MKGIFEYYRTLGENRSNQEPSIPPPPFPTKIMTGHLLFIKSLWKNNTCVPNRLMFREAGDNMRQTFYVF